MQILVVPVLTVLIASQKNVLRCRAIREKATLDLRYGLYD